MPRVNRTQIILGVLTLVGVLVTATFENWDKLASWQKPKFSVASASKSDTSSVQSITGNNNVQISGSNNVVNPPPEPKACRDKSHGIERYDRTFEVERYSQWMGGGFSQDPWCNQVISEIRGQQPEGKFEVLATSESKKSRCEPFNCPEYQYYCKVRVQTDPLYIEKISSACK